MLRLSIRGVQSSACASSFGAHRFDAVVELSLVVENGGTQSAYFNLVVSMALPRLLGRLSHHPLSWSKQRVYVAPRAEQIAEKEQVEVARYPRSRYLPETRQPWEHNWWRTHILHEPFRDRHGKPQDDGGSD